MQNKKASTLTIQISYDTRIKLTKNKRIKN